jgi:HK97 family phage portal protein
MPAQTVISRTRPRGLREPVPFPLTYPASPYALYALLGQSMPATSTPTEETVRGLPAVGAAVDKIANAVATMMVEAQIVDHRGHVIDMEIPPIVRRPNVLMDEFEFYYQLAAAMVMRGNYIAVPADFDTMGYPRQVVPVHIDAVNLDQSSGLPVYHLESETYLFGEIMHIRRAAPVGSLWGLGVVEQYRKALATGLHQQAYESNSFATGAIPSAVVQLDVDKVSKDVAETVQTDWIDRHGSGSRKPAVIPRTMSITPLSWSPEDAEFIEAKRISIAEAALMCGLDPSDLSASIGAGSALTYANITERTLNRVAEAYSPWMQRIERAFSDLIPGRLRVRGRVEALLRTSTRERYELHQLAQAIGLETVDTPKPEPTTDPVDDEEDPDA